VKEQHNRNSSQRNMGGCVSKEEDSARQNAKVQKGTSTIIDTSKNICENEESVQRFKTNDTTEELEIGGLKIRYGYLSQRGYYPDGECMLVHIRAIQNTGLV
jgi:hypothetical protein